MGWGIFVASMIANALKNSVKTSVELGRYIGMTYRAKTYLHHMQEENRQNRLLFVEDDLLKQSGQFFLANFPKRNLLMGESIPINTLPALPASAQTAFYSTVISGGQDIIRAEALCQVCEDVYEKKLPSLILHCRNCAVEAKLHQSQVIHTQAIFGGKGQDYDPFYRLSPAEIADLFVRSAPENLQDNESYALLTELIAELYQVRQHRSIPLRTLLHFDPAAVPDKILDTHSRGLIDNRKLLELNRRYQSAQDGVDSFALYLRRLRNRFCQFYNNYSSAQGNSRLLEDTLRAGGTVSVDVQDTHNEVLIRLVVNHIRLLRNQLELVMCFSDLDLSSYNGELLNYTMEGQNDFVISSPDIVSSVRDTDCLNSLLGTARNAILFQHVNGTNCAVLSESLGTYRRWKLNYTYGQGSRGWIPDNTQGVNIEEETAAKRVPPDVLQDLRGRQMVFRDGTSNQIFLLNLN